MRRRTRVPAAGPLALAMFVSAVAFPGFAAEGDVEAELAKIRNGIEEMKASYEARIQALEKKVAEQDSLMAEVDEKESEIRALKAKVARLERMKDPEGLAERVEQLERAEEPRHTAAPVGAYGGLMAPDISAIANLKAFLSDAEDSRLQFLIQEVELGVQGFLWPGIRGDIFAALEQEVDEDDPRRISTHIDLEEAYVSFLDLPWSFQVQAGRKLQDFGRVNPIHPHHWAFPDTPLPLRQLFGHHPWYDDGVQVSTLVPNPWDVYFKVQGGYWNGRKLGHVHAHEDEHEGEHEHMPGFVGPVDWGGHVATARASLDFPLGEQTNLMAGYSFAGGEAGKSFLHGADLTLIHRWPQTYRRLRWQNELFFGDFDLMHEHEENGEHHVEVNNVDAWGGYSLLQLALNRYWETGVRFDYWNSQDVDDQWGLSAFLTYFFSHSMYLRPAYLFREYPGGDHEHMGLLQFVFGLGPHAHRLED